MPTLSFSVENQTIRRTDNFYVVAGSMNYLYAQFTFTPDWGDGTKTAQFFAECSDDPPYDVILDQNGMCLVPWEVLQYGGTRVFVSVFAGDRITANNSIFRVHDSGYMPGGSSSQPPTPDVYAQIIDRMDGIEADMEEATRRAEAAAESAETSKNAAANSASNASASASAAALSAGAASASAQSASDYATAANNAKADAISAKNDAVSAKNGAVSAKNDAVSAKNDAVSAKDDAVTAKDGAVSAKDDAVLAKNAAVEAQEAAEGVLETMRGLLDELVDIPIAMTDENGNLVVATVLGRDGHDMEPAEGRDY